MAATGLGYFLWITLGVPISYPTVGMMSSYISVENANATVPVIFPEPFIIECPPLKELQSETLTWQKAELRRDCNP